MDGDSLGQEDREEEHGLLGEELTGTELPAAELDDFVIDGLCDLVGEGLDDLAGVFFLGVGVFNFFFGCSGWAFKLLVSWKSFLLTGSLPNFTDCRDGFGDGYWNWLLSDEIGYRASEERGDGAREEIGVEDTGEDCREFPEAREELREDSEELIVDDSGSVFHRLSTGDLGDEVADLGE